MKLKNAHPNIDNIYCYISYIIVFLFLLYNALDIFGYGGSILWDLQVYVRAINAYLSGQNPYDAGGGLLFVYSPYVLDVFSKIDRIVSLDIFMASLYLILTCFFVYQSMAYFRSLNPYGVSAKGWVGLVILPFLAYGASGLVSMETGNITLFLHFMVLGFFLRSIRRPAYLNRALFVISIVVAALVKPYYLSYVIVLPYIFSIKKSFAVGFVLSLFVFLVWGSGFYVEHQLYMRFLEALYNQTMVHGDLGFSIYGLLAHHFSSFHSLVVHVIFGVLSIVMLLMVSYKKYFTLFPSISMPIFVVLAVMVNPRMKIYDFSIAIYFSFAFLYTYSPKYIAKAMMISLIICALPFLILLHKAHVGELPFLLPMHHWYDIVGFLVLLYYMAARLGLNLKSTFSDCSSDCQRVPDELR